MNGKTSQETEKLMYDMLGNVATDFNFSIV